MKSKDQQQLEKAYSNVSEKIKKHNEEITSKVLKAKDMADTIRNKYPSKETKELYDYLGDLFGFCLVNEPASTKSKKTKLPSYGSYATTVMGVQ